MHLGLICLAKFVTGLTFRYQFVKIKTLDTGLCPFRSLYTDVIFIKIIIGTSSPCINKVTYLHLCAYKYTAVSNLVDCVWEVSISVCVCSRMCGSVTVENICPVSLFYSDMPDATHINVSYMRFTW
jgi:hypothetical protein